VRTYAIRKPGISPSKDSNSGKMPTGVALENIVSFEKWLEKRRETGHFFSSTVTDKGQTPSGYVDGVQNR